MKPILMPAPEILELSQGFFCLGTEHRITPDPGHIRSHEPLVRLLQSSIEEMTSIHLSLDYSDKFQGIKLHQETAYEYMYEVLIHENGIDITAEEEVGLFYGIQTLRQVISQYGLKLPCLMIKDRPVLHKRGLFLDLTRGRVLKIEKIKEIIDLAASLKINEIQLYFEHTFKFSFMSEIAMGKDSISPEELTDLDDYCHDRYIELIPCIATFGHLFEVLKSQSYGELCEYDNFDNEPYSWMKRQLYHTIDVTNPDSFALVEAMIEEIAPLTRSPYINICGDETYDLGKGKSAPMAEDIGVTKMYIDFLNKVIGKVESLGKKAMFWGDVIVHHPEEIDLISKEGLCLYWQYEAQVPEEEIKHIADKRQDFYLCSAGLGWNRFMNEYDVAYKNLMDHSRYARKYGAKGMIHTDWGDFGHINVWSASIPTLYMAAHMMWSKDYGLDMETYGNLISKLHYGETSGCLVKEIFKAGGMTNFRYEYLMKWFYEHFHDMVRYGSSLGHFTEYRLQDVEADMEVLTEIKSSLSSYLTKVKVKTSYELAEMIHMVKGMIWQLEFVKVIKKEPVDKGALAISIEEWFMTYETYWRRTSKESELYRIREVVTDICRYLRS